jgi:hypothetical protein
VKKSGCDDLAPGDKRQERSEEQALRMRREFVIDMFLVRARLRVPGFNLSLPLAVTGA